jgi:hypothetical protein
MNMLELEVTEARRRFRLHIIWGGVCAAVAIAAYTAGVVACLVHIAEHAR